MILVQLELMNKSTYFLFSFYFSHVKKVIDKAGIHSGGKWVEAIKKQPKPLPSLPPRPTPLPTELTSQPQNKTLSLFVCIYISQWKLRERSRKYEKKCKICQCSYQSPSIYAKIKEKWVSFNLHMLSWPLVMISAE